MPRSARLAAVTAFLAAAGLAEGPVSAQERLDIAFPPGATGTTIEGTVRGHDYIDHVLTVRGGKTLRASIEVTGTNGHGSVYFNILPAGQDYGGLYTGHMDDDGRAEVTIPADGDWAIRVYLMGNDRDTGRMVDFALDVSAPPA
ncbi:hypothetical protein P6F26_15035 [Roseibacterium sp. SDUM158017]|uniref:hypothetical protein n=1 Tax=Roseicyclus salinarum TaxID=3036773 RepID=UPI00241582F2|nr:hypothetical protein [Roseibacterium sp. SDUM158017]MDG4649758.1 hypothetical protein [Roseibacterium sp. SDUM158017]